jgi:hypothetical protein
MKASSDVMERIGELADTADNFWHASRLPTLDPAIHAAALSEGLKTLRDELRAIFTEVTGHNPWEDG